MARRADHEGDEQIVLFKWLYFQHREAYEHAFHVPNGGKRSKREGGRFKAQGVKPGVPDIFIDLPRGKYHGLRIEFKATPPKDSAVSPGQKEWVERLAKQGYSAMVCKGFEAAKAAIDEYLSLGEYSQ